MKVQAVHNEMSTIENKPLGVQRLLKYGLEVLRGKQISKVMKNLDK